jgi:hypothetical protein
MLTRDSIPSPSVYDPARNRHWAALSMAGDDGISVPELMSATGMGRR